jgi:hypothetical protein
MIWLVEQVNKYAITIHPVNTCRRLAVAAMVRGAAKLPIHAGGEARAGLQRRTGGFRG